jgi:hypothetical protein
MAGPVTESKLLASHQGFKLPDPPAEMSSLPNGFPSVLDSPLAWTGQQLARQSDYIHHLSQNEIEEIEAALKHFKGEPSTIDKRVLSPALLTSYSSRIGWRSRHT